MNCKSIAIDGPAGAGKSTMAKALAKKLGYLYVDTGAIYRTLGLFALRSGVTPSDAESVVALLPKAEVGMDYGADGLQHMYLNGEDVTADIRSPEVSAATSQVSSIPAVRAFLMDMQRNIAKTRSVVMDGRDIGTAVLPNADLKIFLTASPEERARRRCAELAERDNPVDYDKVLADIIKRDDRDSSRAAAPLRQAEDAVLVSTDGKNLEESLDALLQIVQEKLV